MTATEINSLADLPPGTARGIADLVLAAAAPMRALFLAGFLADLERADTAGRVRLIRDMTTASGGTWIIPDGDWPASHLVEISLWGVSATGSSPTDACENWRRNAARQIEAAA